MMGNDSPILPQEVIANILVRLPVKSIIRFQCVCKDWKNLFETQSFIAEHLHHSTQQNPLLVVDCVVSESNHWHLCSLNSEMQVLQFQNQSPHTMESFIDSVYSSNGLLCVEVSVESQYSFWLWNPSIRALRQVPNSFNKNCVEKYTVGFGFSPTVNDYKIVKLTMINYSMVKAEAYALRTNLWKKVELMNLGDVYVVSPGGLTVNGAVFWIGLKGESRIELIVSFDIAMEVFTLIPFPTMGSCPSLCLNHLTIHKNRLAMLSTILKENYETCLFHLWVLEETTNPSSERWSWTKLYTSKPNPYTFNIIPNIVWRNEIVCSVAPNFEDLIKGQLEIHHESQVVLCDLTTNEFSIFAIPIRSCYVSIFDHVESLVLLDNNHI